MIAYPHFPHNPEIETVLEFAKHPENWGEGKDGPMIQGIGAIKTPKQKSD